MLPKTCQISQLDAESSCSQKASGFLMAEGESPMAVFKRSQGLCKGHGIALEDDSGAVTFITMATLAEMMDDEDKQLHTSAAQPTSNPGDTDMPAVAVQPRMEVLPNAPMDLQQLAAELNSRKVESIPGQAAAPKMIEVPASDVPEQPCTKPAMLTVLREKAQAAREAATATQAVLDANNLPEIAKDAMRKAIADSLKQAASYEAQAAKLVLTSTPQYQWEHASSLRAQLMLEHGSSVLAAVELLVQCGVLTVKSGMLGIGITTKKAESAKPKTDPTKPVSTGPKAASTQANEDRNAKVIHLRANGLTGKAIADQLGLTEGQVAGILFRASRVA